MTRIVRTRHFPPRRRFYAINLCGLVFANRPLSATELNHERIHTAQQRELLYVGFFVWYVAEWLWLRLSGRSAMSAYRAVRFEQEAYRHEADPTYLARRRHYAYGQ